MRTLVIVVDALDRLEEILNKAVIRGTTRHGPGRCDCVIGLLRGCGHRRQLFTEHLGKNPIRIGSKLRHIGILSTACHTGPMAGATRTDLRVVGIGCRRPSTRATATGAITPAGTDHTLRATAAHSGLVAERAAARRIQSHALLIQISCYELVGNVIIAIGPSTQNMARAAI